MLRDFCTLYKAALQQRIEACSSRRISLSYAPRANEMKAVRALGYRFERWSFPRLAGDAASTRSRGQAM
jgi:hypothetical protein